MVPSIFRSSRPSAPPPVVSYRDPADVSPTLTATTSATTLDLGDDGPKVVVTRADLRESVACYEALLASAKAYRLALLSVSTASTAFAGALESCARVKGAGNGESGQNLLAASGVQYMVANSGQVLADTLYRSIEIPALSAYDSYVAAMAQRHLEYEALLQVKTAAIRQTESDNMKQGRKKSRDLNQFRRALQRLQEQVSEVEVCKRSYYAEVLESETENWEMIAGKVALLLRSTLDLSDRLASKASSDPVIENMLNEHPDPFDSYRPETEEERDVFSILPPLGMNLGLGGSKRSSIIDVQREDNATPRPPPRLPNRVVTAADVLGLNTPEEAEALDIQSPSIRSSQPPSASSSVSSITPPDSPTLLAASTIQDSPESPPRPTRAVPSQPPISPVPRRIRRPLSRVQEVEPPSDPMIGDWDTHLSPTLQNGDAYYHDEEEEEREEDRRRSLASSRQDRSESGSDSGSSRGGRSK